MQKKIMMKKFFALLTAVAVGGALFTGCSSKPTNSSSDNSGTSGSTSEVSGSITASGSSALAPLVQVAAQNFMQKNPNLSISVSAGGSGNGLNQVAQKSVNLGDSDIFASQKLTVDQAKPLVDHEICVIGMAPVVNPDVTVTSLTNQQLIDIFTGKVTNWNQVGGADEKITLIGRPSNSGTRALFEQYALQGTPENANIALSSDDSGTLEGYVSQTKGSIGYLALSYLVGKYDVKTVAINGVKPTLENIYNGKYEVWGYEHMYTYGDASGATAAFLNYMQSDEFSAQMETLGYNVTSKMTTKHSAPDASSASSK